MSSLAVFATVAALLFLFIVVELVAAIAPLIIVVTLVPPEEREGLAQLLAAADSSRRLRLWRALRLAVAARRLDLARNRRRDPGAWAGRNDVHVHRPAGKGRDLPR